MRGRRGRPQSGSCKIRRYEADLRDHASQRAAATCPTCPTRPTSANSRCGPSSWAWSCASSSARPTPTSGLQRRHDHRRDLPGRRHRHGRAAAVQGDRSSRRTSPGPSARSASRWPPGRSSRSRPS
ncbi:MAG: hypothetical protein MZV64_42570 [Ignavibacteriales bacterium]|nr:hypothetical protein [Ignavibacteriales bacterium]